jgi:hypothetical protein
MLQVLSLIPMADDSDRKIQDKLALIIFVSWL